MENEKNKAKYSAGLFIIFSIAILLFCIVWLRYFAIFPDMIIIAKFRNPGPLSVGVQTYYKGICIGKVKKLEYTKNLNHTLVYIDIYIKNLKMPNNSIAEIQVEGITGQKYVDIVPQGVPSATLIKNNDMIVGKSIFGITDFQYYLQEQVTSGRIERILSDIEGTLERSQKLAENLEVITDIFVDQEQDLKNILTDGSKTAQNMSSISENVKKFSDKEHLWEDLETSITNITSTSENLNKISSDLNDEQVIQNLSSAIKEADLTMCEINYLIAELKKAGVNQDQIASIIKNTEKTVKNTSCMSYGMNKMLSERFLLLKLLFGKPGKHFKCTTKKCP